MTPTDPPRKRLILLLAAERSGHAYVLYDEAIAAGADDVILDVTPTIRELLGRATARALAQAAGASPHPRRIRFNRDADGRIVEAEAVEDEDDDEDAAG